MMKHSLLVRGGRTRYELIDFAKGFSMLTIVLMHYFNRGVIGASLLGTAMSLGGTGVHVFIFCSGFGLCLSFLRRPTSYTAFLRRRFWKIYVPYIAVVLVSAALPYMYEGNDRLLALASHVFLFKMFVPVYNVSFGVYLWFISTIIQFYFCFVPLFRLCEKSRSDIKTFCVALLASVCWWVLVKMLGREEVRTWNDFFLQFLWEFVLGMLVAKWLYRGRNIELHAGTLAATAAVGLGLQAVLALKGLKTFNDIPALFGYGALLLLVYMLGGEKIRKAGCFIGGASYEWYLVHMLVFETVLVLLKPSALGLDLLAGILSLMISFPTALLYREALTCFHRRLAANDVIQGRTRR